MSSPISFPYLLAILLMPAYLSIMLVSSNESAPFLNPDTYLNHLSPSDGAAVQFKDAVSLFILGVSDHIITWP
jgi:hypothetical protein